MHAGLDDLHFFYKMFQNEPLLRHKFAIVYAIQYRRLFETISKKGKEQQRHSSKFKESTENLQSALN